MNRDLVCGCLTLALAIAYYEAAAAIPVSMLADEIGPQGLPISYAYVLGALSLMLIAKSLFASWRDRGGALPLPAGGKRDAGRSDAGPPGRRDGAAAVRAVGVLAIGIAYLVALPWLGYFLSIALLIGAAAWYQERGRRRWLVPVAVGGAAVFWVLFVIVLQVPQPAGLWRGLF